MGEFGFLERIAPKLQKRAGTKLGIGDDCAVLETLQSPVVTLDTLVENAHFRRDWIENHSSPRALGWKSLAVRVSDLAASGAKPVAAFVSLGAPPSENFAFVEELYAGMEACAARFGFTIAGGDTVSSPILTISATLVGELFAPRPLLRSGAQIGDIVSMSGPLGMGAAGLFLLQNPKFQNFTGAQTLLKSHFEPSPRLELVQKIAPQIGAALDISDGISSDARHIAKASGVRLEIEISRVPMTRETRELAELAGQNPLEWALAGGEDYEILACSAREIAGFTPIGRVVAGEGVTFLETGKAVEISLGWRHF